MTSPTSSPPSTAVLFDIDGTLVDSNFAHVAAWEWSGDPMTSIRNIEPLEFESVHLATRSYK